MPKKKESAPPPPRPADDAPAEEGLPLWLATFGDMMSLLLCFFVLLLSFANQDVQKFNDLLGSIKDAFGVQIERRDAPFAALSPSQFERSSVELDQQNQLLLNAVVSIENIANEDPELKKTVTIHPDERGVIMRVPDEALFAPGSADFLPGYQRILDLAIRVLKEQTLDLIIRGHTSDLYIPSDAFPTNWELSSARAIATMRYIMDQGGIPSTRLKAIGFADSQPLAGPNISDLYRRQNSRMEFFFHRPEEVSW